MGGFFGLFDYSKPGPGVPKDEPPKSRPMAFIDIYLRKFWALCRLNLLFFAFNIPALVAMLYLTLVFVPKVMVEDPVMDLSLRFMAGTLFLCVPLVTLGPAQAGFTYVLRNYAREEHAWVWWDFKEHALKNLKESLIICLIDFGVVLLVGLDLNIYGSMKNNNIWFFLGSSVLVVMFVIYLMMHMYIYPMLVTFKLSVKQLYKNALIFAIMKFIPNLGILLLCVLLLFVTFIVPLLGIILFPLITISTIGLLTNFCVYPCLKKYLIDPPETGKSETAEEAGAQEQA